MKKTHQRLRQLLLSFTFVCVGSSSFAAPVAKNASQATTEKSRTKATVKRLTKTQKVGTARLTHAQGAVELKGGDTVFAFAARLAHEATATGFQHFGTHNNRFLLVANPGDSVSKVQKPFTRWAAKQTKRLAKLKAQTTREREARIAALGVPLSEGPPAGLRLDPAGRWWGGAVMRVTVAQLRSLPKGTVLLSTDGNQTIVGVDELDKTDIGGFSMYGF